MSALWRTFYVVVLILAVLLDAMILYFPVQTVPRLVIGLLLVPIILWAGIRLEVNEMLPKQRRWESRG